MNQICEFLKKAQLWMEDQKMTSKIVNIYINVNIYKVNL